MLSTKRQLPKNKTLKLIVQIAQLYGMITTSYTIA